MLMAIAKLLLRIAVVPFCGLVVSRALLEVAHAAGWHPENQLANLMLKSPTLVEIKWVRWVLLALGTLFVWAIADYLLYRRTTETTDVASVDSAKTLRRLSDGSSPMRLFLDNGGILAAKNPQGKNINFVQVAVVSTIDVPNCAPYILRTEHRSSSRASFKELTRESRLVGWSRQPATPCDLPAAVPFHFNLVMFHEFANAPQDVFSETPNTLSQGYERLGKSGEYRYRVSVVGQGLQRAEASVSVIWKGRKRLPKIELQQP